MGVIGAVLGGVGLFLLGMSLMTEGLKGVAGEGLRAWLERATGSTLKALGAGALITALVQSSSATTVATIGFVSAGLLRFEQAVGLIFGANLGTTSTGWLVALLGLKLKVSVIAMPLVGVGALMHLVGKLKVGSLGLALAGFALVFLGLDALQAGMAGMGDRLTPASFPAPTFGGRVLLVLLGLVMTLVMQSSSAAVAMTLTALHAGSVGLEQAAAMVIGQNVGSTVTAMLAAWSSGSAAARRTALAHVAFNVSAGVVAFLILGPFVWVIDEVLHEMGQEDPALILAAFHTMFNVLGVVILLPLMGPFVRWIERMVPEVTPELARHLDPMVLHVPPVAVEAARRVLLELEGRVLERQVAMLRGERGAWAQDDEVSQGWRAVRVFLEKIHTREASAQAHEQHVAALHALDHVRQGMERAREEGLLPAVLGEQALEHNGARLAEALEGVVQWLLSGGPGRGPALEGLARELEGARVAQRAEVLRRVASGELSVADAEGRLAAALWHERAAHHAWRAVRYLAE
jgi:phosphate:Na+ symporter